LFLAARKSFTFLAPRIRLDAGIVVFALCAAHIFVATSVALYSFFPSNYDEIAHISFIKSMAEAPVLFPHYGDYRLLDPKDLGLWTSEPNYLAHPSLYYLFMAPVWTLTNGSALALRLVNVALSSFGLALTAAAGARLITIPRTKLLFILLVFCFPKNPIIGGIVSNDNFVLIATGLFFWGCASSRHRVFWLCLALILAGWTKLTALVGLGAAAGVLMLFEILHEGKPSFQRGHIALDHDGFGRSRSKIIETSDISDVSVNVIDSNNLERDRQISSRNLHELDCAEKLASTFSHPALGVSLLLGLVPYAVNWMRMGHLLFVPQNSFWIIPADRRLHLDLLGFLGVFFQQIVNKFPAGDRMMDATLPLTGLVVFSLAAIQSRGDDKARRVALSFLAAFLIFVPIHFYYAWQTFLSSGETCDAQPRYYNELWPGFAMALSLACTSIDRQRWPVATMSVVILCLLPSAAGLLIFTPIS